MSTTQPPKENPQMATRNPQTDTQLAQTSDDRALAIRRYRQGDRPDEIADALEADLETVTETLRETTDLPPWDDHRALAHLFEDYDTIGALVELFDAERSFEFVRHRMDVFGVDRGATTAEKLESLNPEDVGLSPMIDDEFPMPDEGDEQLDLAAFGGGSA